MKHNRNRIIALLIFTLVLCGFSNPCADIISASTPRYEISLHKPNDDYNNELSVPAKETTTTVEKPKAVEEPVVKEKVEEEPATESVEKTTEVVEEEPVEEYKVPLSMNEIKRTINYPKYKNVVLLNLPFDVFMRQTASWFYEDGMYYNQGVNFAQYRGTCSEAAEATVLNRMFDTNVYTENNLLALSMVLKTCTLDTGDLNTLGGQSPIQVAYNLNSVGNATGDMVDARYYVTTLVPKPNEIAKLLENDNHIIMSVSSYIMWDYTPEGAAMMGVSAKDYWTSNHWIVVTEPKYSESGRLLGFYVVDSSGYGTRYLPIDKFIECTYGPSMMEIQNAACVIVKKK